MYEKELPALPLRVGFSHGQAATLPPLSQNKPAALAELDRRHSIQLLGQIERLTEENLKKDAEISQKNEQLRELALKTDKLRYQKRRQDREFTQIFRRVRCAFETYRDFADEDTTHHSQDEELPNGSHDEVENGRAGPNRRNKEARVRNESA